MRKKEREEMKPLELRAVLKGRFIRLDCGHRFCLHPFSNTMIITSSGKSYCHNCYF